MNDREEMFILRDNTLVKLSRERLFFDRMCEMTERKKKLGVYSLKDCLSIYGKGWTDKKRLIHVK